MKTNHIVAFFLLLSSLVLSSCVSGQKLGKPLSLDQALNEVQTAIRNAAERSAEHKPTGLVAAEVTAVLQIENTAKDSGEVKLSVVPSAGASLGGGWAGEITAKRGNTITVVYKNLLFQGKDTIVGSKTPEEIGELLKKGAAAAGALNVPPQ